jgi:signal transduction histidine kinase
MRVRLSRLIRLGGPSLRRSIALTFAWLAVVDSLLVAGAAIIVINLLPPPAPIGCDGAFPALLVPDRGCGFDVDQTVTGWITVALMLTLAGWSWWFASGWLLRPLSTAAQAISRFGPHNLGERILLDSAPDPLKRLTDALDDALDRLAAGYESQRRFAANASHELRTPLAVQRLLTEVALEDPAAGEDLRRLGAQLLRTNERNEQLIEGLLALAESDRGIQGKVPVRLDELAGRVLDAHAGLAETAGVTLRRMLAPILVPGDEVLLERLIANLVSNAIKYNEPGGWIEVAVAADPALTVRNSGDQVPAEAVPALFEPFRRLGSDRVQGRGGVGLGLAIVRSIVIAHEGTIQARPGLDGGLELEIALLTTAERAPVAVGRARGPADQFRK